MVEADLTSNYFELFGVAVGFEVDLKDLAERYRKLQNTVHPDRFASASDLERRLSAQQSARINEAYQTLKSPLRRASYLLELQGVDMSADSDTAMAPEFLMQQMQLRESLEEVASSADPHGDLLRISGDIDGIIEAIVAELRQAFASGGIDNTALARDGVRRLQFMMRLREEAEALEEQLI